jgi:hypothetical protein
MPGPQVGSTHLPEMHGTFMSQGLPQSSLPPQPSSTSPQARSRIAQVNGVQPEGFGGGQVGQGKVSMQMPQFRVPPQPSSNVPQVLPRSAQVAGTQKQVPFRHVSPATHFLSQLPQ